MDLQQILEHAERFYPHRTAVVCGTTHFSYRRLTERVHRLCHALHGLGIAKGDRLAILMFNCHRYFELYYATPQTGTLAVPLNVRLSASEIAYILKDSGSNTLFVGPEFLPLLAEIRAQLPALQHCIFTGEGPPPRVFTAMSICLTPLQLISLQPLSHRTISRPYFIPAAPRGIPRASCCRTPTYSPMPIMSWRAWTGGLGKCTSMPARCFISLTVRPVISLPGSVARM